LLPDPFAERGAQGIVGNGVEEELTSDQDADLQEVHERIFDQFGRHVDLLEKIHDDQVARSIEVL
jgi:hypothetical protein